MAGSPVLDAPAAAQPTPAGADDPAGSAPAAAQTTPAGSGHPTSPSQPATSPLPVASTIGVEAYDLGTFVLRLTRTLVPAGDVTIYFRNYDVSDHNLWLARPGAEADAQRISDDVGAGGGAAKTVRVSVGDWRLYCSLPGHGSMDRTLTVT
jgi:hypothetical protein